MVSRMEAWVADMEPGKEHIRYQLIVALEPDS